MFFKMILKARQLDRRRAKLILEKQTAWKEDQGKQVKLRMTQKYLRCCHSIAMCLRKLCSFPKNSQAHRACFKIRNEGTCENFTAKSVAGFLGGFFLTYIFFMFFVLQLNFKLSTATIMCSILGSILTIGLAFSYKVRCIVFLVIPQFFSKKGRQALLAYAYILAITGPAKNTLNNMSILGESMACGQEQLKAAVKQIIDAVKKPFYAIRDAIKAVVTAVKEIVIKIKEILLSIKRIIISLLKVIKAGFKFLANIMNMCNKETGTPFERCRKVFESAVLDCNAKLGPFFNWLCNITYLVKTVCYIVKVLDYICIVVDFIKDTVSAVVLKVKQFVRHIRVMFYVRIKFSHSFHFESNRSRTMSDMTTGIVTEIKQRSSGLIKIFDFMSSAASIFFIFMIVKVTYYRYKFLTNERFDNMFITKDFRHIDMRRAQLGMETVLPLNHRERQLYITTSSMRLVKREKNKLSRSAMILLMATLKLSTHMATDYSLYWIMTLIRHYGRFQSKVNAPNVPGLNIVGEGFLANLLRAIVKAFQPIGISMEIDTIPCLPDPIPPDYDRYIQIASLLVLCWFLAIFEPYGLRLRHSVMCYYHPQRARERAIWLYNNIMRSRTSFLKFARRQLRRKVRGDTNITKVTCGDFFRAKLNCKVFTYVLGTKKQDACLLCGEVLRDGDNKKPIKCQTPKCPGLYCEKCFIDLQNLCTVCLDPIQYGDLSDISEEKDSSEEGSQTETKKRKKEKKKRHKKDRSDKSSGDDTDDQAANDKTVLLPKKKRDADSDYYSSTSEHQTGDSSDYSYSYQDKKDITQMEPQTALRSPFVDVEKQNIPEHASMEEFRPGIVTTYHELTDAEFNYDSSSSNITELDPDFRTTRTIPTSLAHLGGGIEAQKHMFSSKLSILNTPDKTELDESATSTPTRSPFCTYSTSPLSYVEQIIDELQDLDHFLHRTNSKLSTESIPMEPLPTETTLNDTHTPKKSDMSTSNTTYISSPKSKITSITPLPKKSDASVQTSFVVDVDDTQESSVHPDVPKLDLKFLDKDDTNACTCNELSGSANNTSSCNCRLFKDSVKYDIVSETKRSSSSSLITEIQSALVFEGNEIESAVDTNLTPRTHDINSDENVELPLEELYASPISPTSSSSYLKQSVGRFSATSSSLISSLAKIPKSSRHFSLSTAIKSDFNIPSTYEIAETVKHITQQKFKKPKNYPKRIFTPSENSYDSPTTSSQSVATSLMDSHPSSYSSRELFFTNDKDIEENQVEDKSSRESTVNIGENIVGGLESANNFPQGLRRRQTRRSMYDNENKYRERVRDYYRQLNIDHFKDFTPPKQKESALKKFFKLFKSKKKRNDL